MDALVLAGRRIEKVLEESLSMSRILENVAAATTAVCN
jgi:hypothetical protein